MPVHVIAKIEEHARLVEGRLELAVELILQDELFDEEEGEDDEAVEEAVKVEEVGCLVELVGVDEREGEDRAADMEDPVESKGGSAAEEYVVRYFGEEDRVDEVGGVGAVGGQIVVLQHHLAHENQQVKPSHEQQLHAQDGQHQLHFQFKPASSQVRSLHHPHVPVQPPNLPADPLSPHQRQEGQHADIAVLDEHPAHHAEEVQFAPYKQHQKGLPKHAGLPQDGFLLREFKAGPLELVTEAIQHGMLAVEVVFCHVRFEEEEGIFNLRLQRLSLFQEIAQNSIHGTYRFLLILLLGVGVGVGFFPFVLVASCIWLVRVLYQCFPGLIRQLFQCQQPVEFHLLH